MFFRKLRFVLWHVLCEMWNYCVFNVAFLGHRIEWPCEFDELKLVAQSHKWPHWWVESKLDMLSFLHPVNRANKWSLLSFLICSSGFLCLHGLGYKLKHLSLYSNEVDSIEQFLQCLLGLQNLYMVTLSQDGRDNPICRLPGETYRTFLNNVFFLTQTATFFIYIFLWKWSDCGWCLCGNRSSHCCEVL